MIFQNHSPRIIPKAVFEADRQILLLPVCENVCGQTSKQVEVDCIDFNQTTRESTKPEGWLFEASLTF